MDYFNIFAPYPWKEIDPMGMLLTSMRTTKAFIADGYPCFNIQRRENLVMYLMILLLKNLILTHGVIKVLPKYVSLVTFPSLIFLHYFFKSTKEPVACTLNMFNFSVIWTLVFLYDHSVNKKYALAVVLSTVGVAFLERGYTGFQFAIDMFLILILAWSVLSAIWDGKYYLILVIAGCCLLYYNMDHSAGYPDLFYLYLMSICWSVVGAIVIYRGSYEAKVCFMAMTSAFNILLCYNIAVHGFGGPIPGRMTPFNKLPTFDRPFFKAMQSKEFWQAVQAEVYKAGKYGPPTEEEVLGRLEEVFAKFEPPTTESTSAVRPSISKPEVESIVYTIDGEGAPVLTAGATVKYRSNKTILY